MPDVIKGVDVASFQSWTYSLDGLDFVFVKATQGTNYVNPKMPQQATRARDAGLVVGFYHFLVRGDISAQAAYFIAKAGARPGEILACDWETAPDGTYPNNVEKDAFLKEVKRLAPTHRVILYCNRSFWTGQDKTSYCGDGLWIADPDHAAGDPAVKHAWLVDQYSSAGGIDHDVAAFTSRDALKKWAGYPPPATPTPEPKPAPSTGETDVSLNLQQTYEAVWKTDAVPAPGDAPGKATNPTWAPVSYLRETYARVRALETELAAVKEQAASNGQALTTALARLDTIAGAVTLLDIPQAVQALQTRLDGMTLTLHTE